MAYTREIDNPALIQYIILYTLAEANRHVTYPQLIGLVLDNCNIEFPNFQLALSNLEQTKHVRRFSPDQNTTFYELLPKGQQANEFFKRDIPIYIREPIKEAIPPFFKEEARKRSVRARIYPFNRREYGLECGIYDNETPLLEMLIYVGTREDANIMKKRFREHTEEIYKTVMDVMTKQDSSDENIL